MKFTFDIEYGGKDYEWEYEVTKKALTKYVKYADFLKDEIDEFLEENPEYDREEVVNDPFLMEDEDGFEEAILEEFYDDAYNDFVDNSGWEDPNEDIGRYYDKYERM